MGNLRLRADHKISDFKIIAILCLISSLGRFVLDSYLPSLPAISDQFTISSQETQFTLTIYLLGFSVSQLIYGPLSDRYGRKSIILLGMLVFFIGSFVCAIASSAAILLISRLIAGMGAGACGVLNRAIASDCFKGADFSKAWSYTTTTLVLTLIIAPVLGGFMQDTFGWRANFVLATLFVAAVFIIIVKFLPETHYQRAKSSFKLPHIMRNYYQILTTRAFILSTLCYTFAFSGLIVYFQVSPFMYIKVFGMTPAQYGWTSAVIAMCYLIGGMLVNKLVHYVSMRNLLLIGTTLLISSGVVMLLTYEFSNVSLLSVLIPSAIYVIGARIVIPNAIARSMEEFRHVSGSSSALIGCVQMFGSALISLIIAHFDYSTPIPLGLIFTLLGAAGLTLTLHMNPQVENKSNHLTRYGNDPIQTDEAEVRMVSS